ncbi:DUF3630 family protein [Pseudoalteromonas sp. MMG010]|uniref:DUF3630 family protein n=1 Tax=Pseudoalteromonas sp. MMG010 TaxID=2822685 RepID=UPI001B3A36C8|nr:DUF3630 family protein [Pseudoalteromonas sp. MMG010]MBQ4832823.1 DUF3630 family protein [Pseudoalteromonas sp. MMG010]
MTELNYDHTHLCITINTEQPPHDEDFELWANLFLHNDEITINDFSKGADRHQLNFSYQQNNFTLNFEHYSESIWIDAQGIEAEHLLAALTFYLS